MVVVILLSLLGFVFMFVMVVASALVLACIFTVFFCVDVDVLWLFIVCCFWC